MTDLDSIRKPALPQPSQAAIQLWKAVLGSGYGLASSIDPESHGGNYQTESEQQSTTTLIGINRNLLPVGAEM